MNEKDYPLADINNLNLDILEKINENERIIKKMLRIPKKLLTSEQVDEIRWRVAQRAALARQLKK